MSSPAAETPEAYLDLALRLALNAGDLILTTWLVHPAARSRDILNKSSSADLVTETDKRCEALVFEGVRKAYPRHHLLGEESHQAEGVYPVLPEGSNEVQWIVDPVDGTNNFCHQLPAVAVSIAVLRGREVIVGVVHRPVSGECCYAIKGKGAFRVMLPPRDSSAQSSLPREINLANAERLRHSGVTNLSHACVATEMGYARAPASVDLMVGKLRALLARSTQSVRMHGSCCANMVDTAAGRIDAYYEGVSGREGPKPWDVSAAALIVTESGAVVRDISGSPFSMWNGRVLVAATVQLADQVCKELNEVTDEWSKRWPQEAPALVYNSQAGIGSAPTSAPARALSPKL